MKLFRILNGSEVSVGDVVVRKGKRYVVESFSFKGGQYWINAYTMCERRYFARMTPEEVGCVIKEEVVQ